MARQLQRQRPERGGDRQRDQQAGDQREPRRRADPRERRRQRVRGQHGGRVGAEADERGLAERRQPADAGQQHEAERDQRVQPDVVRQRDRELGQHQRRQPEQREEDRDEPGRPHSSSSTWRVRSERHQQHRDDQREDDHFLVGARPERRVRLEQADQQRAQRRHRIAREPADDGADEALESDQEAGVVVDRRDRRDQDAGQRADQRAQEERQAARELGRDAHQPRAEPVHRGRAQRLAVHGALEREVQQHDQRDRAADHPDRLRARGQRAEADACRRRTAACAIPRAPNTSSPRPTSTTCTATETISRISTDASASGW